MSTAVRGPDEKRLNWRERVPGLSAHVVLAVVHGAGMWLFAGPWRAIHGFPLDDAWIHQVVARTFATTGTLGYAPGQHGAGATSYLWAVILSANFRWLHVDPVAYTFVVNALLAAMAAQLLLVLVRRALDAESDAADRGPVFRAVQATAMAALSCFGGNFLWFAFSGMEANLVTFLVLLAITLFTTERRQSKLAVLGAGAACGLLAVTRPETMAFGPMLVAAGVVYRQGWRKAALVAGPWALGVAVYVGSNLVATGHPLPATLAGRRWLWLEGSAGLSTARVLADFLFDWLLRLRDYTLGTSATWLLWVCLGVAARGVGSVIRARSPGLLLVVAWSVVHLLTYAVLMPSAGHGGRYQPLTPLVFALLVAVGSVALVRDIKRLTPLVRVRSPRVRALVGALPALGVVPWAALVGVGVRDWRGDHMKAVAHIEATEVALGNVIRELPPGTKVASFDIGGSGFFADRPVLDVGGLSDPRVVTALKEGRVWEYLRDNGAEYVIIPHADRDDWPDSVNFGARLRLFDNPAVRLELVRDLHSPFHVWFPGARSTQHSSPNQGLYRVTFTGAAPAVVSRAKGPVEGLRDPGGLVLPRLASQLNHALAVLAGAGARVDLSVTASPDTDVTEAGDRWVIGLGPWGARVRAPADSGIPASTATAILLEWVEPFIEVGDFGGAARAALEAVVSMKRQFGTPTFSPALPDLATPVLHPPSGSPETTIAWGGPLALVLAAALLFLGRWRLRRSGDGSRPVAGVGGGARSESRPMLFGAVNAEDA